MKQSLQKDTLAYQLGVRPGVVLRDMSNTTVQAVTNSINEFMSLPNLGSLAGVHHPEPIMGNSERDAVVFYLLNHAVSLVRQKFHPYQKLGACEEILNTYHTELATRSTRMFAYMLIICTRESRHAKNGYSDTLWTDLVSKYGVGVKEFHKTIKGTSSDNAKNNLLSSPPNSTLGMYTSYLAELFHNGSFSGGYGGPAWGAVADVLRDYCLGKLTAEMMMDTAFTLCHNNGPIFNKGMLFESYSSEIYKILDVQRSGQIPQLIANKESKLAKDSTVYAHWVMCHTILGDVFSGHVDWFLVEELGALHQYKNEQDLQVTMFGYPSKFKAKIEAEKIKTQLAEKKLLAEASMWVEIMPGVKVQKMESER